MAPPGAAMLTGFGPRPYDGPRGSRRIPPSSLGQVPGLRGDNPRGEQPRPPVLFEGLSTHRSGRLARRALPHPGPRHADRRDGGGPRGSASAMMDLLFSDPFRFVQQLIILIPAFLVAVTVHELAHGLVADRLGDSTARLQGRLTLNPLPHIDPIGAIAFLLAGFGWAKPVPVNAHNLRHPRRDMALVAVAGPVSNFIVAF